MIAMICGWSPKAASPACNWDRTCIEHGDHMTAEERLTAYLCQQPGSKNMDTHNAYMARQILAQHARELGRERDASYWRQRFENEANVRWDDGCPPGGMVCATCGEPVESEPCPEHNPKAVLARSGWKARLDRAESDDPSATALARHIADHPMSTIQAAFRILGMQLTTEVVEEPASRPPELRAQIVEAIRSATCEGDCGSTEKECIQRRIQPGAWHFGVLVEVSGTPEQFADAVLAVVQPVIDQARQRAEAAEAALARVREVCDQLQRASVLADDQPQTDRERGVIQAVDRTRAALTPTADHPEGGVG